MPRAEDGPAVTALIAACPPLDVNSAYCNLLQCSDFAETCIIAERGGALMGWISAYCPPARPDELFIWQVAVSGEARGAGLGGRMLDALLERPAAQGVTMLTTTVTAENLASLGMFRSFARRRDAAFERSPRFDQQVHFASAHATEWEIRIGPFHVQPTDQIRPANPEISLS